MTPKTSISADSPTQGPPSPISPCSVNPALPQSAVLPTERQKVLADVSLSRYAVDICYRNLMAAGDDEVLQRHWCDRLQWWAGRLIADLERANKKGLGVVS
jgi:hypothetical protein